MPDKPILLVPTPAAAPREKLRPARPSPRRRPSREEQAARLSDRFAALGSEFGTAQPNLDGIDPEQVIVLETVGSVSDFQNVVRQIPGMEWLGDFEVEVAEPAAGFLDDGTDATAQPGRIYVTATNRAAFNELIRLWRLWLGSDTEKLPEPYGKLAAAFQYLNDVRPWGTKDRVNARGVLGWWEAGVASGTSSVRFEVELWCRNDPTKRAAAFTQLSKTVRESGGACIAEAVMPEIDYHAALVELPSSAVRDAVSAIQNGGDTQLLRLTEVKYFAPIGQACITPIGEGEDAQIRPAPAPDGAPSVAILDGLPLANHAALQGRLIVDDPDDLASAYRPREHRHGTAMASLVIHGEYDLGEPALESKLYVRPVMVPGAEDHRGNRIESFPRDVLAVDLIHRAVRRMFEGEGETPPQAASVKVINLSLGDAAQPFDRLVSPWARLLDWLAFKYKVLFVVAAGNPGQQITIPAPLGSLPKMPDEELRAHTLRSMAEQRVTRRLFAPAESINALTVGALHAQAARVENAGRLIDPLRAASLPSPVMPVASGFRRSVKPEILVPGGVKHLEPPLSANGASSTTLSVCDAVNQPGQLVAACDPGGASNSKTVRICGSSNAAALTTRAAAQLIERVRELQAEPGGSAIAEARIAVIVKAMLVHGASWGEVHGLFEQVFDDSDDGQKRWRRLKRTCGQFMGYGRADFARGTVCSDQRAIMLGTGELTPEQSHKYDIPLPPALSAQTVKRRLTLTLAWLTPINPRHRSYRVADLWFDPPTVLGVKRVDVDHDAVLRGTVQHEVLEGTDAVPIADGDTMPVHVNCRREAAASSDEPIPYAVLVSLETAEPLEIGVYDQLKAKIAPLHDRLPVRANPARA